MADINNSQLMNFDAGILKPRNACVVLVKTEWNQAIVDELEKGCVDQLRSLGVKKIINLTVPGAFEIPFAIRSFWKAKKRRTDVFIALACVIRGDTPHFDYVCKAVTDGVLQLNLMLPVPTIFGVLTVNDEQQAKDRLGGPHGHKGREAAVTAIKMLAFRQQEK